MKKEIYTTVSYKESFLESQLADENILDESIKSLMDTKLIKKQIELQKQISILEEKIETSVFEIKNILNKKVDINIDEKVTMNLKIAPVRKMLELYLIDLYKTKEVAFETYNEIIKETMFKNKMLFVVTKNNKKTIFNFIWE